MKNRKLEQESRRPIGIRVQFTGDQEIGMEAKSYRGKVGSVWPL